MSAEGGCGCDTVEQKLVPYEDALGILLEQAHTISETQQLPLNDCLNRVCHVQPVC